MSDELHRELRFLEQDYPGMPPTVQRDDLRKINDLRNRLGLPLVDADLREIGATPDPVVPDEPDPAPVPEAPPDHAEARAIYETYLERIEELNRLRTYADCVAKATAGSDMTPVRPLATMGTGGGPLLCDHCGKPMVLEGDRFHRMNADRAWKAHPRDFASYILGGMVVERQTNGTLRIYHGYPGGNSSDCCNAAASEDERARAAHRSANRSAKSRLLWAFIEDEFAEKPERERQELLDDILKTLFAYDPGLGVNRPTSAR